MGSQAPHRQTKQSSRAARAFVGIAIDAAPIPSTISPATVTLLDAVMPASPLGKLWEGRCAQCFRTTTPIHPKAGGHHTLLQPLSNAHFMAGEARHRFQSSVVAPFEGHLRSVPLHPCEPTGRSMPLLNSSAGESDARREHNRRRTRECSRRETRADYRRPLPTGSRRPSLSTGDTVQRARSPANSSP